MSDDFQDLFNKEIKYLREYYLYGFQHYLGNKICVAVISDDIDLIKRVLKNHGQKRSSNINEEYHNKYHVEYTDNEEIIKIILKSNLTTNTVLLKIIERNINLNINLVKLIFEHSNISLTSFYITNISKVCAKQDNLEGIKIIYEKTGNIYPIIPSISISIREGFTDIFDYFFDTFSYNIFGLENYLLFSSSALISDNDYVLNRIISVQKNFEKSLFRRNCFLICAKCNSIKCVKLLIFCCDESFREKTTYNSYFETPLTIAIKNGHFEMVEILNSI